jgi:hypothetical protein
VSATALAAVPTPAARVVVELVMNRASSIEPGPQDAAHSIERVPDAAAVVTGVLLEALAAHVELVPGQRHDVEGSMTVTASGSDDSTAAFFPGERFSGASARVGGGPIPGDDQDQSGRSVGDLGEAGQGLNTEASGKGGGLGFLAGVGSVVRRR